MSTCKVIRINDQMQCSCGLQWDVTDPDPHKTEGLKVLHDAKEALEAPQPDKRCGNCVNDTDDHCARGRWEIGRDLDTHYIQILKNFDVSRCTYWELKK